MRDAIRDWVLVQGRSQRSAATHFQVSRDTVARLLVEAPEEPERRYRRTVPRARPVRDVVVPHLQSWLQENVQLRRRAPKQCWTAHRMWVELRQMGIMVAESTVRQLVRELRAQTAADQVGARAFIPLTFAPAQRG